MTKSPGTPQVFVSVLVISLMFERGVENTFTFVILPGDSALTLFPNIRFKLKGVLPKAITVSTSLFPSTKRVAIEVSELKEKQTLVHCNGKKASGDLLLISALELKLIVKSV